MRVLLVEDETRTAEAVAELLRQEGYEVDVRADGPSGAEALARDAYDVAVLDVMLPGCSGLEVARRARARGNKVPILMLTALGELDDKVDGLDAGADDYLTKPFQTRELLARVRALARRGVNSDDGSLTFGDLALDQATFSMRCTSTGQEVRLREKEFRLLERLVALQGQVVSKEALAARAWGVGDDAGYNKVEVYASFLRKKLQFIGSAVEIKAVRGLGYELRWADE